MQAILVLDSFSAIVGLSDKSRIPAVPLLQMGYLSTSHILTTDKRACIGWCSSQEGGGGHIPLILVQLWLAWTRAQSIAAIKWNTPFDRPEAIFLGVGLLLLLESLLDSIPHGFGDLPYHKRWPPSCSFCSSLHIFYFDLQLSALILRQGCTSLYLLPS